MFLFDYITLNVPGNSFFRKMEKYYLLFTVFNPLHCNSCLYRQEFVYL